MRAFDQHATAIAMRRLRAWLNAVMPSAAIAGEMDDVEKEWFVRELSGNEKLRKEVELR